MGVSRTEVPVVVNDKILSKYLHQFKQIENKGIENLRKIIDFSSVN